LKGWREATKGREETKRLRDEETEWEQADTGNSQLTTDN